MEGYFEMMTRGTKEKVRVYHIDNCGTATIWSPSQYHKGAGGWLRLPLTKMMPVDFAPGGENEISMTQKNKAKKRLKLLDAVWQASDGSIYPHKELDDAIRHELDIMQKETDNNTSK